MKSFSFEMLTCDLKIILPNLHCFICTTHSFKDLFSYWKKKKVQLSIKCIANA
uniref:Uncharacterized protein LOC103448853 n=1 Tax=Rhizophora mucronata TaxID=61149 RepID=A0A2P2LKR8_RHIMU